MTQPSHVQSKPMQALHKVALQYPEVAVAVVCDKAAYKARGKAFLFVGRDVGTYNAMLKLGDSLAAAARLAAQEPGCYQVGPTGWVTVTFPHNRFPPPGLLERWIDESFRLLAPKRLVATLADRDSLATGPTKTAKKKPTKNRAAKQPAK